MFECSSAKIGRHAMNLTRVFLVVAIVAVLPSVPVHAQSDAPRVERPEWPPTGSTWTVNLKLSGSLGSGVRDATSESLGEVDWDGRRVMGNYMRGGAHAYFDAERRIVASVRDGKPIQTYHPYEALYDWPLFAGKSWSSEFQLKIYDRNQTLDLKYAFTVEAFEEVTTPAGTFKTFRIRRTSPDDRYVTWYEPRLGLEVKRDWERYATHPLGIGTHQMEMLSYTIKN
jgi:hypothetical protein